MIIRCVLFSHLFNIHSFDDCYDGLNIIGPPGVPGICIPCTPVEGAPLRYNYSGSQIVVLIKCSSSSACLWYMHACIITRVNQYNNTILYIIIVYVDPILLFMHSCMVV